MGDDKKGNIWDKKGLLMKIVEKFSIPIRKMVKTSEKSEKSRKNAEHCHSENWKKQSNIFNALVNTWKW